MQIKLAVHMSDVKNTNMGAVRCQVDEKGSARLGPIDVTWLACERLVVNARAIGTEIWAVVNCKSESPI